jgi:acetylornithine aminotransferase
MFEPIRGEGGMHGYPPDFARRVRQLCDERGITLIFDEVWTGGGRMGRWFGHQFFDDGKGGVVTPDIMTLGKAIGGGLAVGAMWAKPEIADLLTAGKHGSTLGGNAISLAVASAVFETIEEEGLLLHARALGEHARRRFAKELPDCPVRGEGLFLGLELPEAPTDLPGAALEAGLILNVTQQKVVRLAPGLIITQEQWDEGLGTLIGLVLGG